MARSARIFLVLVTVIAAGACGRQSPALVREAAPVPQPVAAVVEAPPTTVETPLVVSTVATARGASVPVFAAPGAAAPAVSLSNPNDEGERRLFLVKSAQPGWLEVQLPMRPNGSRGWIRDSDVVLSQNDWRALVELGEHRLTVWSGRDVVVQEPVGVGTGGTPTPTGEFYITELLRPPNPNGPYGPYAFGLSAFSDVLLSFAGGPGTIGLHGTNNAGGLGRDVSHGCVRMSNAGITKLAQAMPIGTPITIVS